MPENKFNFDLPNSHSVPPRREGSKTLGTLLLLQIVTMLALGFWAISGTNSKSKPQPHSSTNVEQLKEYAMKLETRNLHREAADAWKEYLKAAHLSPEEEAKIWYHIGIIFQSGRFNEEALASFDRSESLCKLPELEQGITSRTQQCLQALGRVAEGRRNLEERTAVKPEPEQPLVEIGAWKLTRKDVEAIFEQDLELKLKSNGVPPEEIVKIKQDALKNLDGQRLNQYLSQLINVELLYRAGCDDKLYENVDVRSMMLQSDRLIISSEYMRRALAGMVINPSDVQDFYKANPNYFTIPAGVRLTHILIKDEAKAKEILAKAQSGSAIFSTLVKEYSEDISKDNSGEAGWCSEQSSGWRKLAAETIARQKDFSPGQVCPELVKGEDGWHIIKLVDRRSERLRKFDEPDVADEAKQLLWNRKQAEGQKQILEGLGKKYNLIWHNMPQK